MNEPRDRGTISMFTAVFSLAVILFAGLLIDGGSAIHARQRAFDIAEQAARAGADNVDVETLRETGELAVDPAGACDRVAEILAAYEEVQGSQCAPGPDEVVVTVTKTVRTTFLSLAGIGEFTMTVQATAHPEDGA